MSVLRNYKTDSIQYFLYKQIYDNQTYEFLQKKKKEFQSLNYKVLNIKYVLEKMDQFLDPSDPDLSDTNIIHAYQTAERIRKKYPNNEELQVVGLIHDVGKILFKFNEQNWCVVGDTYVVGCQFPKSIVFYDSMKNNPDYNKYDKYGIYKKHCGLDNLYLSFGHDEYLYQVLSQNKDKHKISNKYMNVIRYHSFYPWHTSGEYRYLMNENDYNILKNVTDFNKFDLYSKEDTDFVLNNSIIEYYNNLLDKYFPEKLNW